jgi:hypothetical protein
MKLNSVVRIGALAGAILFAASAFAKPTTTTLTITKPVKIGKMDVQAGEYRLLIDGDKATVHKGKQLVAQADGHWQDAESKSPYDSILVDDGGRLKEVHFAGQKHVFIFNE